MNFADQIKNNKDIAGPGCESEFAQSIKEPKEMSFSAEIEPELAKKLIPMKELTPLDVITAGIRVMEDTFDDEIREDEEFTLMMSQLMTTFLGDVVAEIFDCGVEIKPILKIEEDEDE